jgi:hypothetical protein
MKAKVPFKAYVQVPLEGFSQEELVAYGTDVSQMAEHIENIINRGYQLTLRYEAEKERYSCGVLQANSSDPDEGYGFYGNAPTPCGAIVMASLKVSHLVEKKMKLSALAQMGGSRFS